MTAVPDLSAGTCRQVPLRLLPDFFPDRGQSAEPAKRVCHRCPVEAACLAWAIERKIDDGVMGGLSKDERREIRRDARAKAAQGA
jgi:WhiB family redox-sensing transcriptional regulator